MVSLFFVEKKIRDLAEEISKLKCISCIFLFGSYVNDKMRKDSDIDIAVLTKNATEKDKLKIMGFSNDVFDVSVFSRLPLQIQFRVLRDGKVIFCRSEKDLYDIKVEVFKKYLDFSHFLKNFYRNVIENV